MTSPYEKKNLENEKSETKKTPKKSMFIAQRKGSFGQTLVCPGQFMLVVSMLFGRRSTLKQN